MSQITTNHITTTELRANYIKYIKGMMDHGLKLYACTVPTKEKTRKMPRFIKGIMEHGEKDFANNFDEFTAQMSSNVNDSSTAFELVGTRLKYNVSVELRASGAIALDFDNKSDDGLTHNKLKGNEGKIMLNIIANSFPDDYDNAIHESTPNGDRFIFSNKGFSDDELSSIGSDLKIITVDSQTGKKKLNSGLEVLTDKITASPSTTAVSGKTKLYRADAKNLSNHDLEPMSENLKKFIMIKADEYKEFKKSHYKESKPAFSSNDLKNITVDADDPMLQNAIQSGWKVANKIIDDAIANGYRNDHFRDYARQLYWLGYSESDVRKTVFDTYRDFPNKDDFSQSEVESIINSVTKFAKREQFQTARDWVKAKKAEKASKSNKSGDANEPHYNIHGFITKTNSENPDGNSLFNFVHAFELEDKYNSMIRKNTFRDEVQIKDINTSSGWRKANDNDVDDFQVEFEKRWNLITKSPAKVRSGLNKFARLHAINPLIEKMKSTDWDGKARVETLFIDYLGAKDNEYSRMCARKFLIGAVARLIKPACKFDLCVITIGNQGQGKSTLPEKIGGDACVSDLSSLRTNDKDSKLALIQSWIVVLDEMGATQHASIEDVKSFISRTHDNLKKPYAHEAINYPRQFVIIGNTNDWQPLHDTTGARRFLPLICYGNSKLNVVEMTDQTRWQIIAEAYNIFEKELAESHGDVNGVKDLQLTEHERELAKEPRENAQAISEQETSINRYCNMKVPSYWDDLKLSARQRYFYEYTYSQRYIDPRTKYDEPDVVLNPDELRPLEAVTNQELKLVPLSTQGNPFLSANETKKPYVHISLAMSKSGWQFKRTIKGINGSKARGYSRTGKTNNSFE